MSAHEAGAPVVEIVVHGGAAVGEGPVWLPARSELLWVDMEPGLMHRTAYPATAGGGSDTVTRSLGTFVGAVLPRVGGGWVAATGRGFAEVDDDGALDDRLVVLDGAHRMNDAKCDPWGRLWAGSTAYDFAHGEGALHRLDRDWTSLVAVEGMTLPNGMGWSPDNVTYYLADSVTHEVLAFDSTSEGALSRRRVLHTFAERDGMPDGLCVDDAGCLWVALWGGGRVARLSPEGDRLGEVRLPATQTSSCAFGGAANDVLFVTSAASGVADPGPHDGALFAIHGLGATGIPAARFAG